MLIQEGYEHVGIAHTGRRVVALVTHQILDVHPAILGEIGDELSDVWRHFTDQTNGDCNSYEILRGGRRRSVCYGRRYQGNESMELLHGELQRVYRMGSGPAIEELTAAELVDEHQESSLPASRSFSASAPAPSEWGFASYGSWVRVANGSDDWYRIRANSPSGVDFQMQVQFKDTSGRTRVHAFGGLQDWVDATIRGVGQGSIYVRFKVSTLGNSRGTRITGSVR